MLTEKVRDFTGKKLFKKYNETDKRIDLRQDSQECSSGVIISSADSNNVPSVLSAVNDGGDYGGDDNEDGADYGGDWYVCNSPEYCNVLCQFRRLRSPVIANCFAIAGFLPICAGEHA